MKIIIEADPKEIAALIEKPTKASSDLCTYDEYLAQKREMDKNEYLGILKDHVRLLSDWNKAVKQVNGCEEQVRHNCETISLLIAQLTQLGC